MFLFRSKGSTPLFVNIAWHIWSSRIVITNMDIVVLLKFSLSSYGDSGLYEVFRQYEFPQAKSSSWWTDYGSTPVSKSSSGRSTIYPCGRGPLWPALCQARSQSSKMLWMFVYMSNHEGSAHWSSAHFGSRLVYLCISVFCQWQREGAKRCTATMAPTSRVQIHFGKDGGRVIDPHLKQGRPSCR